MPLEQRGPADHRSFGKMEGRMAGTEMDKRSWKRLLAALKLTYQRLSEKKLTYWLDQFEDAIYQCRLQMEIEGLEEIRPIMKAMIGYDPLERDTRPKGEKRSGLTRSETRETKSGERSIPFGAAGSRAVGQLRIVDYDWRAPQRAGIVEGP